MKSRFGASSLLLALWLVGSLLLAFIILPLLGLGMTQAPGSLQRVLAMADVRAAIWLSIAAALVTALLAMVLGAPLAYVLSRGTFPGRSVLEAIVDIPLTIPHTVAGIALLIVFGRRGLLGAPLLDTFGISFWSTFAGVVVAMLFVSAPYAVNAAKIGFDAIDPRIEKVARTLGAGPWRVFVQVTLPLVWRSLMTGFTLSFARSISEFGSVAILAYYPMTAPVKIYDLFLQFGLTDSAAMSLIVLLLSLLLFIVFRYFLFGRPVRPGMER